jgi:sugar lactone lactonase YvrE
LSGVDNRTYFDSVAFSPDGALIATGSEDNTARLWDVQAKTLVHTFEGHTDPVNSVAFSPDGALIATGSEDNTVRLWDVQAKTLVHTFEGHTDPVNSAAFSPDGALIATGSGDKTVRLWDVQAKTLVHTFEGHTDWVSSVAFSPDGALIATGSWDNTVRLWDVQAKRVLQTLVAENHGNWLSIDRQQQVFRGDDGTLLKKRAIKNGNWLPVPVAGLSGHDNYSISVAPDPMTISPGESKEVRIQVINTGAHPAYWLHLKPSTSDDEAIRLDPPNHLFKGKGAQAWKPARIAKLEPGDTATLFARITPNLKLPAAFVRSGLRRLVLAVVSANNTEVSQAINVDVQSPNLEWQRASLEQDGKTLKIELQNSGTVALRDFTLELYARGAESTGHTSDQSLSQQIIQELAPAAVNELAVVLPDGLDLKSQQLTLQGRTRDLPIFSWNLPAPDIERAGRLLYWILAPLLLLTLIALFYLRRYRHPLVVRLSSEPALLLKLPPEQLEDARIRLEQTRRLEQIMSEAEVTRQTLSQAITFIKEKTPQEKAQWLAKRLGTTAKNLQPALWELRLPDNFPLNLDRCLLYFPAAGSEPKALFDDLKAIEQTRMRATVLIGPNSEYQRKLYDKTKDRTNKLVAPSGSQLTHLLLSPEPEIVLAKILADQLTLTQLSPYQLGGGVNRESVFFGRQEIISHIMNRDPANYLVVSGRQLGKSSLLKALERRYLEQPDITCRYLVLSSEVLVPRLASELGLSHDTELEQIAAHLAERKGRFIFLIDEADKFVRFERETDYQILDALRRMSEEGHCAFILAGFWELYEHAMLDYQSPLKNFAEIVQIGELETEACRQLATLPMQNMRLAYASPDLVDQLLEATGQRANLMAIACDQILEQLKADQRIIEADDVQRSLYSDKTFEALKGWDAMTDDKQACQLDRIVVYATVHKDRFDLAELVEIMNQHGLKPDGH